MPTRPLFRAPAWRRDPAPVPGVLPGAGRDPREALTSLSSLGEIEAAAPALRAELKERARAAGLLVVWVAAVGMPLWTLVDRTVAPAQAELFLVVRLIGDLPILAALWALTRSSLGHSRPEALAFVAMTVVQLEIAWMITRVDDPTYYLLGFTLAIYGSGCILVARPRCTVALVAVSWAALVLSVLLRPVALTAEDLVAGTFYVGTASVIALLAHVRRSALSDRELLTRVRFEREEQRTATLLAELERLSHEDPLTGLANRRRWDATLAGVCATARDRGSVVGVVLLDVDHFKSINDHHGHPGGDEALRQVARLLACRVRSGDVVARLGGDEFAVLLPGADLGEAVELAERLRVEAAELVPPGFGPGEVRLSLGVASVRGAEVHPLELMARADAQLYRAKTTRDAVGAPVLEPIGRPQQHR